MRAQRDGIHPSSRHARSARRNPPALDPREPTSHNASPDDITDSTPPGRAPGRPRAIRPPGSAGFAPGARWGEGRSSSADDRAINGSSGCVGDGPVRGRPPPGRPDRPSREAPSVTGTYIAPTWDEAATAAAIDAAEATLTAYLDASDPDAWWRGLSPHLTPGAQEAYADVDPSTIVPAALIPDAAAVVSPTDDGHLLTALVQVPTDKGVFGVALVREGGNEWLAWRIVLPGMPAPTEAAR